MSDVAERLKAFAWGQLGEDAGPEPVVVTWAEDDEAPTHLAVVQAPHEDGLSVVGLYSLYEPKLFEVEMLKAVSLVYVESQEQAQAVVDALRAVWPGVKL